MIERNFVMSENVDKEAFKANFMQKVTILNEDNWSFHIENERKYDKIISEVECANVTVRETFLQTAISNDATLSASWTKKS